MAAQPQSTNTLGLCSVCGNSESKVVLAEAQWYPFWNRDHDACPACVQQNLLQTLLAKGELVSIEGNRPIKLAHGEMGLEQVSDGNEILRSHILRIRCPGNPLVTRKAKA